jgi:hypothetical protein
MRGHVNAIDEWDKVEIYAGYHDYWLVLRTKDAAFLEHRTVLGALTRFLRSGKTPARDWRLSIGQASSLGAPANPTERA